MSVPRVFVSSTYYDLRQHRNNIAEFIKSLGYDPIMHERSGVAYTQTNTLEEDCYHELASCDIVVCIIGNHFGSKSSESELSITMEELRTAIKSKKKIYVFVSNDVYIENKTYKLNKDNGEFKSAYTDNIKIHEYILELTETVKNHVIVPFDNTDQIISVLRGQFAGLFQNLLARESAMTESKTAYDLQESADSIKTAIKDFEREKEEFFAKFDSSVLSSNGVLYTIKKHIGMDKSSFFAKDLEALDEFMKIVGFSIKEVDDAWEDARKYVKEEYTKTISITLKYSLIEDNKLSSIRNKSLLDNGIIYSCEETNKFLEISKDDELPF